MFLINTHYAAKMINHELYDPTLIRNLSAQSKSTSVKICAFVILGNEPDAKRLIKREIDNGYYNLLMYKTWPVITPSYLSPYEKAAEGAVA